jgi:hypothetical protein
MNDMVSIRKIRFGSEEGLPVLGTEDTALGRGNEDGLGGNKALV